MTEYQQDDPLLRALREARPATDDARLSPDAPKAAEVLARILAGDQATSVVSLESPRRVRSRRRAAWAAASVTAAAALVAGVLAGTGAFRGSADGSVGRSGSHRAATLDARVVGIEPAPPSSRQTRRRLDTPSTLRSLPPA